MPGTPNAAWTEAMIALRDLKGICLFEVVIEATYHDPATGDDRTGLVRLYQVAASLTQGIQKLTSNKQLPRCHRVTLVDVITGAGVKQFPTTSGVPDQKKVVIETALMEYEVKIVPPGMKQRSKHFFTVGAKDRFRATGTGPKFNHPAIPANATIDFKPIPAGAVIPWLTVDNTLEKASDRARRLRAARAALRKKSDVLRADEPVDAPPFGVLPRSLSYLRLDRPIAGSGCGEESDDEDDERKAGDEPVELPELPMTPGVRMIRMMMVRDTLATIGDKPLTEETVDFLYRQLLAADPDDDEDL